MPNSIIQIVPRLPPVVDGLGDYAAILGQNLLQNHQIHSRFLVTDPDWIATAASPSAHRLPDQQSTVLTSALTELTSSTVFLHFVNYAYAPTHGCPIWLLRGIKAWRKRSTSHRLVTMFHELYATSRHPWRKVFWCSPIQRALTMHLARLSDDVLTSNTLYADQLKTALNPREAEIWPVLSNIGEPSILPFNERRSELVVFGRAVNRQRAYQRQPQALQKFCADYSITTLHDVGEGSGATPPSLPGVTIRNHGQLPASELSELLKHARFGLLDIAGGQFCKSGVFAAYASHGVIPVVEQAQKQVDGLAVMTNYLALNHLGPAQANLPGIATAAYNWYQEHTASKFAARVASLLSTAESDPC